MSILALIISRFQLLLLRCCKDAPCTFCNSLLILEMRMLCIPNCYKACNWNQKVTIDWSHHPVRASCNLSCLNCWLGSQPGSSSRNLGGNCYADQNQFEEKLIKKSENIWGSRTRKILKKTSPVSGGIGKEIQSGKKLENFKKKSSRVLMWSNQEISQLWRTQPVTLAKV